MPSRADTCINVGRFPTPCRNISLALQKPSRYHHPHHHNVNSTANNNNKNNENIGSRTNITVTASSRYNNTQIIHHTLSDERVTRILRWCYHHHHHQQQQQTANQAIHPTCTLSEPTKRAIHHKQHAVRGCTMSSPSVRPM